MDASVRRQDPEDFIVRFGRLEDCEAVLRSRIPTPPFHLIWHPWRRTSLACRLRYSLQGRPDGSCH